MNLKIMLVDDVDISNYLLKRMITKISLNTDVFDFVDSTQAFEALTDINPDIIFLDLNMPGLNGWQFLDRMKKESFTCKVVIVTSSISILDKQLSDNYSNVIDYLEKPVIQEKLLKCLQSLKPLHVLN